jgi:hypothetical protein
LTPLVPINSLYLNQLVERQQVQFDARKCEWIGTQEKAPIMLCCRADASCKSVADIIKANEPPKSGYRLSLGQAHGRTLRAKLNTMTGYQGGGEVVGSPH